MRKRDGVRIAAPAPRLIAAEILGWPPGETAESRAVTVRTEYKAPTRVTFAGK